MLLFMTNINIKLLFKTRRAINQLCGYLYVGQVALFELLQHSKRSLLVELTQCINGPFI